MELIYLILTQINSSKKILQYCANHKFKRKMYCIHNVLIKHMDAHCLRFKQKMTFDFWVFSNLVLFWGKMDINIISFFLFFICTCIKYFPWSIPNVQYLVDVFFRKNAVRRVDFLLFIFCLLYEKILTKAYEWKLFIYTENFIIYDEQSNFSFLNCY